MKTTKKIITFTMTAMLAGSLLCGCSGSSSTSTATIETTDTDVENTDKSEYSNTSITGSVTAIEGNEISLTLIGNGQGMGEKPDGTPPSDSSGSDGDVQTPPDRPDGDNSQTPPDRPDGDDSQTPPDRPDGDNSQTPPEKSDGDNQTASDQDESSDSAQTPSEASESSEDQNKQTLTITITDEAVLQDIALSDITTGTMLTVTFDENGAISSVAQFDPSDMQPNGAPSGNTPGGGTADTGTGATTITEDTEESDVTYDSENEDENALRIEGSVNYSGTALTIHKTGDTSDSESSDFYGLNAGILSLDGAATTITDSTITTDAKGANGIFAYGSDTSVTVSNTSITTSADNAGGLDVTGGATLNATNLDITTGGNSSAAIRSDRGGGTLVVSEGSYTTNGTGSPAIYCTADITVSDATLTANASEGVVIEGKNSVTLNNCDVTSNMQGTYQGDENENLHAIMIYQSMSGDADEGEGSLTINGGSITGLNGDLIYSTNTTSVLNLNNVALTLANDTLLRVSGNDSSRGWGTAGSNGADMKLSATNQSLTGKIIVDEISSLILTMSENSTFEGSINEAQEGGTVTVSLDDSSTWKLTADSYITSFEGSMDNVDTNGFTLYVNGVAQN